MHHTLTLLCICATISGTAQVVLFEEDFSGTPAFALNTTDVGSVAVSPDNTWVVNNGYAGGDGSLVCLGIPFSFTVPNTPAQPAGMNDPNGPYLHIASQAALSSGIQACCFRAADGLCANAANHFARMSTDVSTVGMTDVTVSFWWLCTGSASNYGEVYYSTDTGVSWNLVGSAPGQYMMQGSWVQQSITLPAFGDQATLRIGFRFVNNVTFSASDPAFAIDDLRITAAGMTPPSVEAGTIAPLGYCQGAAMQVPYETQGTFEAGNTFTAQLSDATGSFATPVAIGSVSATTSGTIACTIPPGTSAGTGYRVRVVSSAPVLISPDNGVNITVDAPYSAGTGGTFTTCANSGTYDLFLQLGGDPASCGSWMAPGGGAFDGQFDSGGDAEGPYIYYTSACGGTCPATTATIMVILTEGADAGTDVTYTSCSDAPPADLEALMNGQAGGVFLHPGGLPDLTIPGVYNIMYAVDGPGSCEPDTADLQITVQAAANAGNNASVQICVNHDPTPLLSFLGGADTGGTWLGPDGLPFGGTFDPAVHADGVYIYTVPGVPPCSDESAAVAVVVDPCTTVGELNDADRLQWSGQDAHGQHLFIGAGEGIVQWEVFDATGRAVAQGTSQPGMGRMRIAIDAATGVHLVRVLGTDGRDSVLRIHHQR